MKSFWFSIQVRKQRQILTISENSNETTKFVSPFHHRSRRQQQTSEFTQVPTDSMEKLMDAACAAETDIEIREAALALCQPGLPWRTPGDVLQRFPCRSARLNRCSSSWPSPDSFRISVLWRVLSSQVVSFVRVQFHVSGIHWRDWARRQCLRYRS